MRSFFTACPRSRARSAARGEPLFRWKEMAMRKIVLLLAGLLLILGRAAWIDVALAEKSEPSKAGSEKADFEGWKYPGSKELGSGQGAGGFHAMLTTADGLDKVESFYERKTG